jgi:hypothetical protein
MNTETQTADDSMIKQEIPQTDDSYEIPVIKVEAPKSPKNSGTSADSSPSTDRVTRMENKVDRLERKVENLERLVRLLSVKQNKCFDTYISSYQEFEVFFFNMLPMNFKLFLGEKNFSLEKCLFGIIVLTQVS